VKTAAGGKLSTVEIPHRLALLLPGCEWYYRVSQTRPKFPLFDETLLSNKQSAPKLPWNWDTTHAVRRKSVNETVVSWNEYPESGQSIGRV
jgi:hypothetical protein